MEIVRNAISISEGIYIYIIKLNAGLEMVKVLILSRVVLSVWFRCGFIETNDRPPFALRCSKITFVLILNLFK